MRNHREGIVAGALFALSAFASATGTEPALLLPGEGTSATIVTGETKTVGFAGVEGSKLTVTATAPPGSRVLPKITLSAPDGSAVDVGNPNPRRTGRAQFRNVALDATGVWRIGVQTLGVGGKFQIAASAHVPHSFKWTGDLDGATASDHTVPAAPGGTVAVSVAAKGKPAFEPSFDLLSPSGAVIAHATGTKGRAILPHAALGEIGRYTVRVTGGPGAFKASAVVKPGKAHKRVYKDVESRPDLTSFTPTSTTNQRVLALQLVGAGFAAGQIASIANGTQSVAAGPVGPVFRASADASIDVAAVAPGTYSVLVTTAAGNTVAAPGSIVIGNRTPFVGSASQAEFSNQGAFEFDVRGEGFDDAAELFVRHAIPGELPLTLNGRTGHSTITATLTPPAYLTGPCEIEVRDPDGASGTLAGAFDLVGLKAPPVVVGTHTGAGASNYFVQDAAYDDVHDRVLLAIHTSDSVATFVLLDLATLTVADSVDIAAGTLGVGAAKFFNLSLACDPIGGTFAICACSIGDPGYGLARVVSTTDIHHTISNVSLAPLAANEVSYVQAAPNPDVGGYLVIWDEYRNPGNGSTVKTRILDVSGSTGATNAQDIATDQYGLIFFPCAHYQGSGRFVLAYAGYTPDYLHGAVYTVVADGLTGAQVGGLESRMTSSDNWTFTQYPVLATNPDDGSMLLEFTYSTSSTSGSVFQRLQPVTAGPDPFFPRFEGTLADDGAVAGNVVWNPTRKEFVATYVAYPNAHVTVRRITAAGQVKPALVLETHEGFGGIVYSGSAPDTLGLVRTFDGVADGVHDPNSPTVQVVAGPIR